MRGGRSSTTTSNPCASPNSNPSTLVLTGEQSPVSRHEAMRALDGALPDCEPRILAGQGHVAAQTAPDLLAAEIFGFWGG